MSTQKTLVIGSSGMVGSELVRILRRKGLPVRETTSQSSRVTSGEQERVLVDLVSGKGVRDAFAGVDQAFLLSPPGHADQHAILSPLIQEAKRRGLKKVVLMTAMGANANDAAPFRRAEIELEKSGLTYNIIRPNWFMQNFHTFWGHGIKSARKIDLPAGVAKTSFIDARDIAEVAAVLLTSDRFTNKDFDLTGGDSLTHAEVAQQIGEALKSEIEYTDIDPKVLHSGLVQAGLPVDYVNFLIMIFGFLREGYSERVTGAVKEITGRDPRRFDDYARAHTAMWT